MIERRTGSAQEQQPGLVISYSNQPKRFRPLDCDILLVGTAPGCELGIEAAGVAPVHCVIVRGSDAFHVRNCAGRLGTRVNGFPIQESPLSDQDQLQIGPFVLEVRIPAGYFQVAGDAGDAGDAGNAQVRERQLLRLQRSRRHLTQLALGLRRRVVTLRASSRPVQAEQEFARRQADLLRQSELLRNQIQGWEECTKRLDLAEQQLNQDREALDKERAAVQARVRQFEEGLEQRHRTMEQQVWSTSDSQRRKREEHIAQEREALKQERLSLQAGFARLDQVEAQLKHDRTALDQQRGQLEAKESQIAQAQQRLAAEEEALKQRLRQLEEAEGQVRAARDGLERERTGLQDRIQQLEQELTKGRQQLDQQHQQIREEAAALPDPEAVQELENQRQAMAEYAAELQEMEDRLREMEAGLNAERAQLEEDCAQLQAEKESWSAEHEALASAHDSNAAELTEKIEAYAREEAALKQKHIELIGTIDELKEMQQHFVTEHEAERDDLLHQIAELRQLLAEQTGTSTEADGTVPADETVEELRNEIFKLRKRVMDQDALIQGFRGERSLPASELGGALDTASYEVELNLQRRQLELDRIALNAEIRQAQQMKAEVEAGAREMELELSRERASLSRERAWLDRLREEVRIELERVRREAGVRDRLAPFQTLLEQTRGKNADAQQPANPPSGGGLGGLLGRFGGKRG
jgi:chromosome segregation ATPase